MKRLISLLAAFLLALLPFSASAQDYVTSLSWQADEAGVQAYLLASGMDETGASFLAAPMTQIMNQLGMQLAWNDAMQFAYDLSLADQQIIGMDASYRDEQGLKMSTSLFEGVVFLLTSADVQQLIGELSGELENADALFANVTQREETGYFVGDAYAGGKYRTVYELPLDKSTAGLHAVVSLVYGDHPGELYSLLGISGTLGYDDGRQLLTFSAGQDPNDNILVVLGFGADGHTYYSEYRFDPDSEEDVVIDSRLLMDDGGLGYAVVSAMPEALAQEATIHLHVIDDSQLVWSGSMQSTTGNGLSSVYSGSFDLNAFLLNHVEQVSVNGQPAFTCTVATTAIDGYSWPDHAEDAVIDMVRMTADDTRLLDQAAENGMQTLLLNILQVMPWQFMQLLVNLFE